jgi:hypothetical protein
MKGVLLLAFYLCLFTTASAQDITIKVTVSGQFGIEEQVTSRLNRHFRQFKDVALTDGDAYFIEVGVIVLESKSQEGDTLGYALSVEVREPIDDLDGFLFKERCPKGSEAFKYYVGSNLSRGHFLYVTPPDKLDNTCQKIVEIVDTNHLEPLRKSRRQNPTQKK